jgi:Cu2+-exporting ATPase
LTLPVPVLLDTGSLDRVLLTRAGRLAAVSRHPLGRALAEAAHATDAAPTAHEIPGRGIEAEIDGRIERLGSPEFCGVATERVVCALKLHPGASLVAYASGDAPAVLFAFRQGLRDDAAETVARLKAAGYAIEILSGDRSAAVSAVAEALQIHQWAAELTPTDKIARLDVLKSAGHRVLMVGDGLNDAPALAAAHVSLAPVTAVHLAEASADAVFLGERLGPVADALQIARRAHAAMRQNLWFAVAYNVVAVPFAMAGLLTPLIAALAMSGSSLVVTLNALRLRSAGERPT